MSRGVRGIAALGALAALLTGCGIQIPNDPHGTLDRVAGGTLRVGATENPPWVELEDDEPEGSEPALIEAFAAAQDATVEWTTGSEADLLDALERGRLDVVVGGFLDDTPWVDKAATTFPYTATAGGRDKHVMLVRMGENGLLVALERFLFEEGS
ncbi:transporter substrate-binding domain-containing protein [Microbacterium sp. Marseille-Q6965]|uniref:transporter substrate-binding domain-containing protein n=1 Tax=Microbacterium sp. Marseille-Q6965 TaxID=2965072 RepID=UPI0021B73B2D|nr:transporter substrate-binding domain-containing protein [Microbacterium sp. Marseille-Q6965]